MKFNFKQMLKVSAFNIEKQKMALAFLIFSEGFAEKGLKIETKTPPCILQGTLLLPFQLWTGSRSFTLLSLFLDFIDAVLFSSSALVPSLVFNVLLSSR